MLPTKGVGYDASRFPYNADGLSFSGVFFRIDNVNVRGVSTRNPRETLGVPSSLGVMKEVTTTRGPLQALVSAIRIPQWVKNGLVFVAPAAAGTLRHRTVLVNSVVAFFAFCAVASSIYLINDLRDVADDRQHPTKRSRAIASGQLHASVARVLAVVLLGAGFALPLLLRRPAGLYLIIGLYVIQSLVYIGGIKRVPIVEMIFVASGFFLRAYGGAVASHIPVSEWFLVVISFGALFLVVGKRSAEIRHVGTDSRSVLTEYSTEFLHSALTLSATVAVTAYCLWAFDTSSTGLSNVHHHVVPLRLTVVLVVMAILFVIRGAESVQGEQPEDLVLRNHTVQALGLTWIVLAVVGVYG